LPKLKASLWGVSIPVRWCGLPDPDPARQAASQHRGATFSPPGRFAFAGRSPGGSRSQGRGKWTRGGWGYSDGVHQKKCNR
jgi:hypothetical protein